MKDLHLSIVRLEITGGLTGSWFHAMLSALNFSGLRKFGRIHLSFG